MISAASAGGHQANGGNHPRRGVGCPDHDPVPYLDSHRREQTCGTTDSVGELSGTSIMSVADEHWAAAERVMNRPSTSPR
jgi:hypothetical protein